MKDKKLLFNLTLAAIFAAAIFIAVYLLQIRLSFGANINFGDTLIYIAASLMPMPYAMAAGAIGASLADTLSGYPVWVPADIIIKSLLVIYFTNKNSKLLCKRNIIAVLLAGATGLAGYFVYDLLFISGSAAVAFFYEVALGALQPIICGAAYIAISAALDSAGLKERIRKIS